MGDGVVRTELKSGFKVANGSLGGLHIIAHVTAVYVSLDHLWIFCQGARVVVNRLLQKLVLLGHVSGQQGEIRLFGQDRLVTADQGKDIVIAPEVVIIVGEI